VCLLLWTLIVEILARAEIGFARVRRDVLLDRGELRGAADHMIETLCLPESSVATEQLINSGCGELLPRVALHVGC
jgi:hypothetical protein